MFWLNLLSNFILKTYYVKSICWHLTGDKSWDINLVTRRQKINKQRTKLMLMKLIWQNRNVTEKQFFMKKSHLGGSYFRLRGCHVSWESGIQKKAETGQCGRLSVGETKGAEKELRGRQWLDQQGFGGPDWESHLMVQSFGRNGWGHKSMPTLAWIRSLCSGNPQRL